MCNKRHVSLMRKYKIAHPKNSKESQMRAKKSQKRKIKKDQKKSILKINTKVLNIEFFLKQTKAILEKNTYISLIVLSDVLMYARKLASNQLTLSIRPFFDLFCSLSSALPGLSIDLNFADKRCAMTRTPTNLRYFPGSKMFNGQSICGKQK